MSEGEIDKKCNQKGWQNQMCYGHGGVQIFILNVMEATGSFEQGVI